MIKTATKTKKTERVETTTDGATVNAVLDDFNGNGKQPETVGEMIPIEYLETSPTNPRKRFPQDSINELAASIREQGIIEPLVVRPIYASPCFEIVCGERRYKSSQLAGLAKLPCIVRPLTDEQVLDIQIHENLHREDVHPMDEAYGYQFLKEKLGCNTTELALRVGKSEKYVLNRLKLNTLIEEAQKDIEAGHLPLTYALEIAKYSPEAQKVLLDQAVYQTNQEYKNGRWVRIPIKGKPDDWTDFKAFIEKNILWRLSAAPFDIKATNLRADGLPCPACPDRTGANASLFDGELVGKKDSCLNPMCFRSKAEQHVTITRERVAHEASVPADDIPLIHLDDYSDSGEVLGTGSFTVIGKKPYKTYYRSVSEKPCDKQITAINVGDGQYGKTYTVCLKSSGCKTHHPGTKPTPAKSAKSAEKERERELIKKRERREEIVDCYVSDHVRKRVFRLAAELFSIDFSITKEGPDTFLAELLTKLWLTSTSDIDSKTRDLVAQSLMRQAMDEPKALQNSWRPYGSRDSQTSAYDSFSNMSARNQKLALFLFVHGNKGQTYGGNFNSQIEVKALAEYYGIDYRLIDAEERLAWAEEKAKKHIPAFKLYLDAVRAGDEKAKIPRPYAETYKRKD